MIAVNVKIKDDTATPFLKGVIRDMDPAGPLAMVLGRALANVLKKHFRARNSTPNKLGGARTNFWSGVASAVSVPAQEAGGVVVSVSHPAIAQKVFGGTITPKKAKYLSIPIDPRAHGKSPRVFQNLHPARTKSGKLLLGLTENGKFSALYVLVKSVTQAPDPQALPEDSAMLEAVSDAAKSFAGG